MVSVARRSTASNASASPRPRPIAAATARNAPARPLASRMGPGAIQAVRTTASAARHRPPRQDEAGERPGRKGGAEEEGGAGARPDGERHGGRADATREKADLPVPSERRDDDRQRCEVAQDHGRGGADGDRPEEERGREAGAQADEEE